MKEGHAKGDAEEKLEECLQSLKPTMTEYLECSGDISEAVCPQNKDRGCDLIGHRKH